MVAKKKCDDTPDVTRFAGFLCVKKADGEDNVKGFMVSSDFEAVEKFAAGDGEDSETDNLDTPEANDEDVDLSPVASLCRDWMERFNFSLTPFHKLIAITTFMRGGLEQAAIKRGILGVATERGALIRDDQTFQIFGLPEAPLGEIFDEVKSLRENDAGFALLPASILLSLVATSLMHRTPPHPPAFPSRQSPRHSRHPPAPDQSHDPRS